MSNDKCREIFREKVHTDKTPVHDFDTICAINEKHVDGILDDQSGDPLVYEDRVIGIVSWVHPISKETGIRVPSVFTRISEHKDWINDRIKWAE